MDTLRGYSIKRRKDMAHWPPLLEEWLLSLERYSRIMAGDDAAYWYNERANLGVLAAAAWRCGRIALEEFQHEKGYRNRQKKRGRCDLWLGRDMDEEIIEAKFRWAALRGENSVIDATMLEAEKAAKKSRGNDRELRSIGVGFFPVYVSPKCKTDVDELIELAIARFHQIDYHALAWCFPKENRTSVPNKNVLPGIFLVARNINYGI